MSTIVAAALTLAGEVMKYVNTKNAQKLINDVKDLKLKILEEEGKGYTSDDAKLETLYAQAKVLMEAATSELNLHVTS